MNEQLAARPWTLVNTQLHFIVYVLIKYTTCFDPTCGSSSGLYNELSL